MSRFLLFCLDSTFFNSSQQDAFGPKLLRDTRDAGADIQRIQLCCSVQTMRMVPNGSVTDAPASALKMQRTIGPINIRAKPCYRYQNTQSRPMGGVSITNHTSRYPMGGWTLQIYRNWWVILGDTKKISFNIAHIYTNISELLFAVSQSTSNFRQQIVWLPIAKLTSVDTWRRSREHHSWRFLNCKSMSVNCTSRTANFLLATRFSMILHQKWEHSQSVLWWKVVVSPVLLVWASTKPVSQV